MRCNEECADMRVTIIDNSIFESHGLNFVNCFVAHYDINHIENGNLKTGNSYAVPVIVGHILNFLVQQ